MELNVQECPDAAELVALLKEDLSPTRHQQVLSHIEACAKCQHRLDEMTDVSLPIADTPRTYSTETLPHPSGSATAQAEEIPASIGPFKVDRLLGEGGFGSVYLAWDPQLQRQVAVKVLARNRCDARTTERFIREAQLLARIHANHVVGVMQVGEMERGRPYMVMEFLDGGSLAEWSETANERIQSRGELDQIARYVRDAADGLDAIHAASLVHRDIKPGNILIEREPHRAKLADFGLARADSVATLTIADTVIGTPAFMSPEQAIDVTRVDHLSDVYSLGATLYQLTTGQPPFRGTTQAILRQIADSEPTAPTRLNPSIPRDLETICIKAMEKEPAKRYASAALLREDLQRYLDGVPIHARPISQVERSWRWCRRNPPLAIAITMCAVSLIAGTVVSSIMWKRSERSAQVARQRATDLAESNRLVQQRATELTRSNALATQRADQLRRSNSELSFAIQSFYDRALVEDANYDHFSEKFRNDLVDDMLKSYTSLVHMSDNDPEIIRSVCQRTLMISELCLQHGRDMPANRLMKGSVELFAPLLESTTPAVVDVAQGAAIQHQLARAKYYAFGLESALPFSEEAVKLARQAVDRDNTPDHRRQWLLIKMWDTSLRKDPNNRPAAHAKLAEMVAEVDELAKRFPDRHEFLRDQDAAYLILSSAASPTDVARYRDLRTDILNRLIDLLESEGKPTNHYRRRVILNRFYQAVNMLSLGRIPEAREAIEGVIADLRQQHSRSPGSLRPRVDLAEALVKLGDVYWNENRRDDAFTCYHEAVDFFDGVIAQDVHSNASMRRASQVNGWIGQRHQQLGDVPKAIESYEAAVASMQQLFELPAGYRGRGDEIAMARLIEQTAKIHASAGNPDRAEELRKRASTFGNPPQQ